MERVISYNLGEDFILNLSLFLEENFLAKGKDLSSLALVFGGKRPSLFLKKELSGIIKKGFFPPHFFSIDEFVEYLLSQKEPFLKLSDLDACFILYNLARDITGEILQGRQSFSQFLPWAREILSFIEQMDLEDINRKNLENIQLKAAIGFDIPENINALLKSIITLRDAFHQTLKKKHAYSRGLIYLLAAQYIQDCSLNEFAEIYFCGLFFLHKTEKEIIKNLYARQKATLFFQGSASDWAVLEKLSQEIASPIRPSKQDWHPEYKLYIQAGFDVHSQACLVREALKKIGNLDKTVIVLPLPENLMVLLSEISGEVQDFNVSLGYPLKRSSLYALFECIFIAQETVKDGAYYTKDYLHLLSHPLIKNLRILPNPSITRVLVHKIEEILLGIEEVSLSGSLFIKIADIQNSRELYELTLKTAKTMDIAVSWDELKEAVKQLHELLFIRWEALRNFQDFSLSLEKLLHTLLAKGSLGNYPLNLKMAEKMFAVKEELASTSFNQEPFPKEDIFKIFKNKLSSEMISFSGSPLKGLQILGLFETRSLHFQNVVVMDVNESVLPALKIYEALIPREVTISLGLNRLEKEEEIQRYQFKRLIAGAKNVYLIHQERDDKEKSRFIEEIIWERQKEANSLEVLNIPRVGFKVKVLPKKLQINKNPQILKYLQDFEYSASSLNTYMHCPLNFYYRYVMGLQEREDLLEEPEGRDIGKFIHELLAQAFGKFIGRRPYIDTKFKKEFLATLDKKFTDEFQRKMKSDAFLIKEIMDSRMQRFLEYEAKREVKEVLCLEKIFQAKIKLRKGSFKFKAVVDRIDKIEDGTILILDYKTGSSEIMPQGIDRIEAKGFSRDCLRDTLKSFQLPLYLYLVGNDLEYKDGKINACLYSLKDFTLNMLFNAEELTWKETMMQVYLKAMESIMDDILNPDLCFTADDKDAYQCAYCPFFYLCR